MACPGFTICPNSDGTLDGCKRTCACVYCGNQSQVTACQGQCVSAGGGVSVGVNTQPVTGAVNSIVQGILGPLVAALPLLFERIGLFLFAMVLVVVGFLVVKS